MKILIWMVCLILTSTLITALNFGGISLGGIPTFLIYVGMIWLATTLCKKWDKHKGIKPEDDKEQNN